MPPKKNTKVNRTNTELIELTEEFIESLPVIINHKYNRKGIGLNGLPLTRRCINVIGRSETNEIYYCLTRANYSLKNVKPVTHCEKCIKSISNQEHENLNATKCKCGCNKTATYGKITEKNKNTGTATHCEESGSKFGYRRTRDCCIEVDCWTRATFGEITRDDNGNIVREHNHAKGVATHCKNHGDRLGYFDVVNPLCDNCDIRATFGTQTAISKVPTRCSDHRDETMKDLVNKKCLGKDGVVCLIQPVFNIRGSKTGIYCKNHADHTTMIDVVSPSCEHPKCETRAGFNECGDSGKKFCEPHIPKTDINPDGLSVAGMVRKREKENKACITCKDINKPATHGYLYDTHKRWCAKCSPVGSINLNSTMCITCKSVRPSFGIDKPTFCETCNVDNLPDLVHKECILCNAHRAHYVELEVFNREITENEHICPMICSHCFVDGKKYVNVASPICLEKDCKSRAYFNIRGEIRPLYCKDHADRKTMIDVVHDICLECSVPASYNYEGEKIPIYCKTHIREGMVSTRPKCITPHCDNNGYKKYYSRCFVCFSTEFPLDPLIRKFKTKERATVDHITSKFNNYTWVADKVIDGGCSKKRPDLYLDMGEYAIIIEVDEMQHRGYAELCEQNRVGHLIEDATKAIVLIRFNPDSYQGKEGKVSSCWGYTPERGMHTIISNMQKDWDNRLLALEIEVNKWINASNFDWKNNLLTEIKLFYDYK
jgi:hypothetical protein